MDFKLDQNEQQQIRTMIFSTIKDAVRQVKTTSRPYLNRRDIAKYFGVSESTISLWANLGMPVAVIDGRKLYGKQSITQWLKGHEKPINKKSIETKKPVTIGVVTSNK